MNDISTVIVAPETIARSLESVVDMIRDQVDGDTGRMVENVLRTAARNTRMLFEFKADDRGYFRPSNMGEVMYMVDLLMRGGMAPSSYKGEPAAIALGLMKAMEIDVDPISGIGNIMVVNNRASVWGDLAQALVQRSGTLVKHEEEKIGTWPEPGTELAHWPADCGWRWTAWRKGEDTPYTGEYTVGDARRAKLWMDARRQPWITDPGRMIFNRARARALRDGFSDALFGLSIAEEQMDFGGGAPASAPMGALPKPLDDEPVTSVAALGAPEMNDFGSGDALNTESVAVGATDEEKGE